MYSALRESGEKIGEGLLHMTPMDQFLVIVIDNLCWKNEFCVCNDIVNKQLLNKLPKNVYVDNIILIFFQ